MDVRFGPAGKPLDVSGDMIDGVRYCHTLGLTACEIEFVRGVWMKEEYAHRLASVAEEQNVLLSCHAPYWVNCCAVNKATRDTTKRLILATARIAAALNAAPVVFHPGYYLKRPPSVCKAQTIETLREIVETLVQERTPVLLGLETVGKHTAFGNIEEIIEVCHKVPHTTIVLDFAHLYARGIVRTYDETQRALAQVERELSPRRFHIHFSEIEYTTAGERSHLPFGTKGEPNFSFLARALIEGGYPATIICETPELERDAVKLKRVFEEMERATKSSSSSQ